MPDSVTREVVTHGRQYFTGNRAPDSCPECNNNQTKYEFLVGENAVPESKFPVPPGVSPDRKGVQFTCQACGCVWKYLRS